MYLPSHLLGTQIFVKLGEPYLSNYFWYTVQYTACLFWGGILEKNVVFWGCIG